MPKKKIINYLKVAQETAAAEKQLVVPRILELVPTLLEPTAAKKEPPGLIRIEYPLFEDRIIRVFKRNALVV